MNISQYSFASDSRRWWWPSAATGVAVVGAVAAILALPAHAASTIPDIDPGLGTGAESFVVEPGTGSRPCFMVRPRWNVALDGPQPVCDGGSSAAIWVGVIRDGLDSKP